MVNVFTIHASDDKIWNHRDLIKFLVDNQHKPIELVINPEAICLESLGLYDLLDEFSFESVKLHTFNLLEEHPRYQIVKKWATRYFDIRPTVDPALQTWNQQKVFLSMFCRPTASRLGLASYLYANYPEQSHVHFSCPPNDDNITLFEFDKLAVYDKNSIANVGKLLPNLPLRCFEDTATVDTKSLNFNMSGVTDLMAVCFANLMSTSVFSLYQDVFVDVVSESHVLGNTFYVTEKTARAFWAKKPFLIFAARDHLAYLRQLGFRTFYEFWDEDYDGYEGRDRYLKMLQVIDFIAKKPASELVAMYNAMQSILDHNHNLMLNQKYQMSIKKII